MAGTSSGTEPGPDQALTELLGDPEQVYPVIQLTGTNGKGSTAAMIESLLRANGLRTGRFTSPHVVSVTERITIDEDRSAMSASTRCGERSSRTLHSSTNARSTASR